MGKEVFNTMEYPPTALPFVPTDVPQAVVYIVVGYFLFLFLFVFFRVVVFNFALKALNAY